MAGFTLGGNQLPTDLMSHPTNLFHPGLNPPLLSKKTGNREPRTIHFFRRNSVPQYMQLNNPVHSRLSTAVAR